MGLSQYMGGAFPDKTWLHDLPSQAEAWLGDGLAWPAYSREIVYEVYVRIQGCMWNPFLFKDLYMEYVPQYKTVYGIHFCIRNHIEIDGCIRNRTRNTCLYTELYTECIVAQLICMQHQFLCTTFYTGFCLHAHLYTECIHKAS